MISRLMNVGDRNIAFDGVDLSKQFVVCGVDMPMLPEISIRELEIAGKPGSWYSGRQIGTRDIEIRLGILNMTSERAEALENWVNRSYIVSREDECRLDLGLGYWVNCVLTGTSEITRNKRWNTVTLTFHCCDPFIYRNSYELPLNEGKNNVFIDGTCNAYPIFEINPTGETVQIIETDSGRKIKIDNVDDKRPVVVDMERRKCTQNGLYKPMDPTATMFWGVSPGDVSLTVTGGSGALKYTEVFV